jgi:hypothetical protein
LKKVTTEGEDYLIITNSDLNGAFEKRNDELGAT